ncbi:MAG: pilus assembly protein [Devosia sp.]|nr:pilus assembly protein [Devosia sp.]
MTQAFFSRMRGDSGGAAIEFALLTPVFLLMVMGVLAYGIYFGAANSLQQLAADAARIAISGLSEAERNRLVAAYLDRHAQNYLLIERTRLEAQIGDDPSDPSQYRVQLRYDAIDLPIWNLYPPLPLPSRVMVVGATIRQGGL